MIFDASSIFVAIRTFRPEILKNNTTSELARYEIGNALWKEVNLHKTLKFHEAERLMDVILRAIQLMNLEKPEWKESLRVSSELNLTFYDASYVQLALSKNEPLVTEDEKLRNKAKRVIDSISVSDLI
jgi:predicted nucleic acid-binding protein